MILSFFKKEQLMKIEFEIKFRCIHRARELVRCCHRRYHRGYSDFDWYYYYWCWYWYCCYWGQRRALLSFENRHFASIVRSINVIFDGQKKKRERDEYIESTSNHYVDLFVSRLFDHCSTIVKFLYLYIFVTIKCFSELVLK